jgi:hypothetical protein
MSTIVDTIIIKYMMDSAYIKRTVLLATPNILITILSIMFILLMNDNRHLG